MHIETIVVGMFEVNCFLVHGREARALIVDPGADAGLIAESLARHGLTPAAYLLTHGHVDHVSALAELVRRYPAPVACHPDDLRWAFTPANAFPPHYAAPHLPEQTEVRSLADRQTWRDAGLDYEIIETPGHSPGSVCFLFRSTGVLFSGDTLFAGSVGRTDLPGGNARRLAASLRKFSTLSSVTRVLCGHGPETTLGRERRVNFFLQHLNPEGAHA